MIVRTATSRGAAREFSPGRKPWVNGRINHLAPEGRQTGWLPAFLPPARKCVLFLAPIPRAWPRANGRKIIQPKLARPSEDLRCPQGFSVECISVYRSDEEQAF